MQIDQFDAIPLLLALDQTVKYPTEDWFEPFMANENTVRYLQSWALYCARSVHYQNAKHQEANKECLVRAASFLGDPVLPDQLQFYSWQGASPLASSVLLRMFVGDKVSEYQLPLAGSYKVFMSSAAATLDSVVAQEKLIAVLINGLKNS